MNRVRLLQIALISMAITGVVITITTLVHAVAPTVAQAPASEGAIIPRDVGIAMAAGLAMGIVGFGAAIGMGMASASAAAAIAERPEVFVQTMLYVVFIEAIAIYALVVAIMLIGLI